MQINTFANTLPCYIWSIFFDEPQTNSSHLLQSLEERLQSREEPS